jgi:hypothetical protein
MVEEKNHRDKASGRLKFIAAGALLDLTLG